VAPKSGVSSDDKYDGLTAGDAMKSFSWSLHGLALFPLEHVQAMYGGEAITVGMVTAMHRFEDNGMINRSDDLLCKTARKVMPMCLLLPLLGTGLSYITYAKDVASSDAPWMAGALVTVLCVCLPVAICLLYRQGDALKAYGTIMITGVFAVYFFFGVAGYFFYFGFAPLPLPVRLCGLIGGLALSAYWIVISIWAVHHTLGTKGFTEKCFVQNENGVTFAVQSSMAHFEKLHKERSPFPRIYYWLTMGIAPFCLILNRLLSPVFNGSGVLFVIAVLAMPMSLWLISLLVRFYLVMVALPRDLERRLGKPVRAIQ
jgi:hypothetical protein